MHNARINCVASWTFFCAFVLQKIAQLVESDLMRLLAFINVKTLCYFLHLKTKSRQLVAQE
jgi:hypothetical protein